MVQVLLPETVTEDYLTDPILMPADLKKGGRKFYLSLSGPNLTLSNYMEDTFIYSGEYITITAEDPENPPPPDEHSSFPSSGHFTGWRPCGLQWVTEDDDIDEFQEIPTSTVGDQEWDYTVSQL